MSKTENPSYDEYIAVGRQLDDWPEVLRRLDEVAVHLPEHGPACNLGGGGVSVHVAENPEMTAERYAAEIIAWGERRRARIGGP